MIRYLEMKYKVGDKVKIKTWKALKQEFGTDCFGRMSVCSCGWWTKDEDEHLDKLGICRVVTIKKVCEYRYITKGMKINLTDEMIEYSIDEKAKEKYLMEKLMNESFKKMNIEVVEERDRLLEENKKLKEEIADMSNSRFDILDL